MDARGASYGDLARRTDHALSAQNLHKLATEPRKAFPDPRTLQVLSDLLDLPLATIVLACARAVGLEVRQAGTALDVVLPPGTDELTAEDREAVRVIVRALIDARRGGPPTSLRSVSDPTPPLPDFTRVAARRGESEGQRLRREQDEAAEAAED